MCYSHSSPDMKQEIDVAVDFLIKVVTLNSNSKQLQPGQVSILRGKLSELLHSKYINHWFPDFPVRGSGYRCIRINGLLDPLVRQAGELSGVSYALLRSLFPPELTLWVDPREVAYRFGENGSICTLLAPAPPTDMDMDFSSPPLMGHHSPRNRSSPTADFFPHLARLSPASPVGSPYNRAARVNKASALAQKLEFAPSAKNVTHFSPLSAYSC